MKNRYGMDGLSYSLLANTATGRFEVFPYQTDLDDEAASFAPKTKSNSYDTDTDARQKAMLAKKLKEQKGLFEFERK